MDLALVDCFYSQNSAHKTEALKTFSDQEKEDINQNTLKCDQKWLHSTNDWHEMELNFTP